MEHVLSLMIFLPILGALVVAALPTSAPRIVRGVATGFSVPPLLLAAWLFQNFDRGEAGFQFVERLSWIPGYRIEYFVGVDGLSISLVLLTALLSFLCLVASAGVSRGVKGYYALFLLLEAAMVGVFVSLDLFLFYVFWELMLLPMYFLIGIWGGPRREYAAIKFFLYTLLGSVLILIAMLALYFGQDPHSFDLTRLHEGAAGFSRQAQLLLWTALFLGFAIKIPVVPFHTWLPDAHVEAPTAISVILAGVLLKMGAYGILRVNFGVLPEATVVLAPWLLGALGAVNLVYGALCALAQSDLKRLVAYSSVSHMGYVMLGMAALTPQGIDGAVLQMFNHGTISAMMFLIVGVLYDRAHHREIDGFGGVASVLPRFTAISMLAFFAALGLPGLAAFVSEVLVLLGTWPRHPWLAAIGASTVVLTAGYVLWMVQRVYLGEVGEKVRGLPEITARELGTLLPLAALVVLLGVYPNALLNLLRPTLHGIVAPLAAAADAAPPADGKAVSSAGAVPGTR